MAKATKRRRAPVWRGRSHRKQTTISVPVTAQVDSSMTLPTKLVVSVVYQEQTSANAMNGTGSQEAATTPLTPAARAYWRSTSDHWVTRLSSATVATQRAIIALEIHES